MKKSFSLAGVLRQIILQLRIIQTEEEIHKTNPSILIRVIGHESGLQEETNCASNGGICKNEMSQETRPLSIEETSVTDFQI